MLGRYTTGPRPAESSTKRQVTHRADDRPARLAGRRGGPPGVLALSCPAMPRIDLRSDTVTHPTPAMRRAMADAEVGDDVFGDDPTVNALEERAAELLGKEAGLFVASGTMGNLVAQLAHLARGEEMIAAATSHLVMDEAAGHAVVVGASVRSLAESADGTIDPAAIAAAFRDPEDPHEPMTGLVALENTHAHSMGRPLTVAYEEAVAAVARRNERPPPPRRGPLLQRRRRPRRQPGRPRRPRRLGHVLPLEGPRLPGRLASSSAPATFIRRARRGRKLVGGGMRQAGILAAAGLVALSDGPDGMIERLADDHANARRLAEALADLEGVESPGGIVPADLRPPRPRARRDRLRHLPRRPRPGRLPRRPRGPRRARWSAYPHDTVRAVTHYGVDRDEIDATIAAVREALAETAGTRPTARAEASHGHRGLGEAGPRRRDARLTCTHGPVLVIPSLDLTAGRSRIVFWPGAAAGVGAPTDRPEVIAARFVDQGARVIHLVDFDGAQQGRPANLDAVARIASRVAVPLQLAGGLDGPDEIRLAFAAGATRAVVSMRLADDHATLLACLAVAGDWLAVGLDPRPDRLAAFPWQGGRRPSFDEVASELAGLGVRRLVLTHGGVEPDAALIGRLVRDLDLEVLVAGGVVDLAGIRRLREAGAAGVVLGEALLTGRIEYPAAMEAAA